MAALTHRSDSRSDASCPVITSLSLDHLQRDDLRGSDNKHTRLKETLPSYCSLVYGVLLTHGFFLIIQHCCQPQSLCDRCNTLLSL